MGKRRTPPPPEILRKSGPHRDRKGYDRARQKAADRAPAADPAREDTTAAEDAAAATAPASAPPPMLNLDSLPLTGIGDGARFAAAIGRIAGPLGATKLGASLVELAPGKRGWPFHLHYGQEELFVILAGTGTIRYGEGSYPLRAGDVVFTPPGPGTAHQIVNDSDAPLRYLAFSSMDNPEVCYYPDSGKVGSYAGAPGQRGFFFITHEDNAGGYWDGES